MKAIGPQQGLNRACLSNLLGKALGRSGVKVIDWKVKQILGGLEFDSLVYRIQGNAREAGKTFPWSLILKIFSPSEKLLEPSGLRYWKREALAYQSGLLHQLPGGNLTAPICYEVSEQPDGSLWIWLEDIQEDLGTPWPVEHYAVVARHLGQFNGAYLTGQALPDEPWLARNWLRKYVGSAAPAVDFLRSNPRHPCVKNLCPGDTQAQILGFWDERNAILETVEKLPQVFCHQDAFRKNLFARKGKTVAIDWGYLGIAPVGAELVALVAGSISLFEVPVDQVQEMDRICFEGYLQGLHDAGWGGDPKIVRTGYAVSCLLRYPIAAGIGETLPALLNKESRTQLADALDHPAEEIEKTNPALISYYQSLIPETLKLLGMKNLLSLVSRIGVHTLRLRIQGRN